MNTVTIYGFDLQLANAHTRTSGHGHYIITVELMYNGYTSNFSATTDNMPAHDAATDLEGKEKQLALYNIIARKIEDIVFDWINTKID
jgi:dTDP-4-dehydrorhamnose reductase